MIKTEKCCIFTFFTNTGVMQIEKKCKEQGIEGKVVPVPRQITSDCGIAFKSSLENKEAVLNLCQNIDFDRYYEIEY